MTKFIIRAAVVFAALLSAPLLGGAPLSAHAQPPQQQPTPRAPKKKLQASSNFAQYAGRDSSNRLIAGGATRNLTDPMAAAEAAFEGG